MHGTVRTVSLPAERFFNGRILAMAGSSMGLSQICASESPTFSLSMTSLGRRGTAAAGRARPMRSHAPVVIASSMAPRVRNPPVTMRTRFGNRSRMTLAKSRKKASRRTVEAFFSGAYTAFWSI